MCKAKQPVKLTKELLHISRSLSAQTLIRRTSFVRGKLDSAVFRLCRHQQSTWPFVFGKASVFNSCRNHHKQQCLQRHVPAPDPPTTDEKRDPAPSVWETSILWGGGGRRAPLPTLGLVSFLTLQLPWKNARLSCEPLGNTTPCNASVLFKILLFNLGDGVQ